MTAPTPHPRNDARSERRARRPRLGATRLARTGLALAGLAVAATVTIAATSGTSGDAEATEAQPVEVALISTEAADAEIDRLQSVARKAEESRVADYVEAVQQAERERAFVAAVEAARAEQAAAEAAAAAAAEAAAAEAAAAEAAAAEAAAAARATSSGGGGLGGGWAALRRCESGGDYGAVSSSGTYRGAYQFSRQTWDATARRSYPNLVGVDPAAASPGDQDAMAQALYRAAGAGQWPHCGRNL